MPMTGDPIPRLLPIRVPSVVNGSDSGRGVVAAASAVQEQVRTVAESLMLHGLPHELAH